MCVCVYGLEQRCGARLCTFKFSWDGRRSGREGMTWRDEGIGLYCIQIEFIFLRDRYRLFFFL